MKTALPMLFGHALHRAPARPRKPIEKTSKAAAERLDMLQRRMANYPTEGRLVSFELEAHARALRAEYIRQWARRIFNRDSD